MTIHKLSPEHEWLKYPAFYNAYPLPNEIAAAGADYGQTTPASYGDIYLDDYYGRIFDKGTHFVASKYGRSSKMKHYVSIPSLEIFDELRVPYRRIPIFLANNLRVIAQAIEEIRTSNSGHHILLRGQSRTYIIERSLEESRHFYSEEVVREPSFLPSHLRNKFDPYFLKCMWQSQAAILLNDIGYDLDAQASYQQMASGIRASAGFVPFALGIAQHYGMPSVGLDLTDNLKIACWFATHTIAPSPSGLAKTDLIKFGSDQTPTVFVFRCPPDAVFDYKATKPNDFPCGRPDSQYAWFGHVGWGLASNQLASYLMCGFRLTRDIANDLGTELDRALFPAESNDPILHHFLKMRAMEKYEGEAKRALQGIYYMDN